MRNQATILALFFVAYAVAGVSLVLKIHSTTAMFYAAAYLFLAITQLGVIGFFAAKMVPNSKQASV